MLDKVENLKNKYSMQIQYLYCYNAGENVALKKHANRKGWGGVLIYCSKLPNGHVRQKNSSLFNRIQTTHNGRKFNAFQQNSSRAEAVNTTMLLKNNLLTPNRTLSPFQQFFEKRKRSILSLMQKFGEMSVTIYRDNSHHAKLANHGT